MPAPSTFYFVHNPYSTEGWIAPPVETSSEPSPGIAVGYYSGLTRNLRNNHDERIGRGGHQPQNVCLPSPPQQQSYLRVPMSPSQMAISPSSSLGSLSTLQSCCCGCHCGDGNGARALPQEEFSGGYRSNLTIPVIPKSPELFPMKSWDLASPSRFNPIGAPPATDSKYEHEDDPLGFEPLPSDPLPRARGLNFGETLHDTQKFLATLGAFARQQNPDGCLRNAPISFPLAAMDFNEQSLSALIEDFCADAKADPKAISTILLRNARCGHLMSWKRLRAKRGMNHLLCYYCGVKWKTTRELHPQQQPQQHQPCI